MKTTSWEQIKAILRGIGSAMTRRFESLGAAVRQADETADQAAEEAKTALKKAEAVNKGLSLKLDKNNPVATGAARFGQKGTAQKIGDNSFAAGTSVDATGDSSAAFNGYSSASGNYSFAANQSNAIGWCSSSEGFRSYARGDTSHVEGYYTDARKAYQHVQGYCNLIDDEDGPRENSGRYLHIVGNGDFDENGREARSNAHTLDWEGNGWFAGYVEGNAMILPSPDGTRWRITVGDDGALSATKVTA